MLGELLLHLLPVPRDGHVVDLLQPHPLRLAQHAVQVDIMLYVQCQKLLVTIFRNLVKSRNMVRFGLAFTIAKRYYIHV